MDTRCASHGAGDDISIESIIRHRTPFLFVDKVRSIAGNRIDGVVEFHDDKDRWCNNFCISPESMIEAFAQLSGIHARISKSSKGIGYLVSADNGDFPVPVFGPSTVMLTCERLCIRLNQHVYRGRARVDGQDVGRCDVAIHIQPEQAA